MTALQHYYDLSTLQNRLLVGYFSSLFLQLCLYMLREIDRMYIALRAMPDTRLINEVRQ